MNKKRLFWLWGWAAMVIAIAGVWGCGDDDDDNDNGNANDGNGNTDGDIGCADFFKETEEAGYVRCGYEDNEKMEGPIRCDMMAGEVCCALGGRLEDRRCMTQEECGAAQEKNPGMTNNQECDESSDCLAKYGADKPWCCAPWLEKKTECRKWEDCLYEERVTYVNCLLGCDNSCPPGTACIANDFAPDLWYCDPASYDGPEVDIYAEPPLPDGAV